MDIKLFGGISLLDSPFLLGLSTEVVVHNIFVGNSQIVQHFGYCLDHHWRSAQVVFDIFGVLVVLQIVLEDHLVYEARFLGHAVRIGYRVGTVEG